MRHDQDLRDAASADVFEKFVFIAVLVARLTDHPDEDLEVIRYAASRFVVANRLQKARDLAEQALVLAVIGEDASVGLHLPTSTTVATTP